MQFDYTAVGHVTVDVMADGTRRPGGSAFYGALQAARLGGRALILTAGVAAEIEEMLSPYLSELELVVAAAPSTTALETLGDGASRRQRVLAWAGPMAEDLELDTAILHLAPVAREGPIRWRGRAGFVGLTPQGLLRRWQEPTGDMTLTIPQPDTEWLARGCDAIVVSEQERTVCTPLVAAAAASGALVVVTAGPDPCTIIRPGGGEVSLSVTAVDGPSDDLGAGDVFAAALFVELAGGRSADAAVRFAAAAAAVRMRGCGAAAIGRRSAIEHRVRETAGPDSH